MTQSEEQLPLVHQKANLLFRRGSRLGDESLKLNGIEVGQWVSCIGIVFNAKDRLPQVYLTLDVFGNLEVDLADSNVDVTESSRKALMALGWTPPKRSET
jgi:hypothetical protein